jgi:hypothetical protein
VATALIGKIVHPAAIAIKPLGLQNVATNPIVVIFLSFSMHIDIRGKKYDVL